MFITFDITYVLHLYFPSDIISYLMFIVSLPRGQIQEIKYMLLMHLTHGLFLTGTQNVIKLWIIYYNIYMLFNASFNSAPCFPPPCVYLLGEPTSLLVVANTHPPLSLVCQQLPHPLIALQSFHTPRFPTVQVTLFIQMT